MCPPGAIHLNGLRAPDEACFERFALYCMHVCVYRCFHMHVCLNRCGWKVAC